MLGSVVAIAAQLWSETVEVQDSLPTPRLPVVCTPLPGDLAKPNLRLGILNYVGRVDNRLCKPVQLRHEPVALAGSQELQHFSQMPVDVLAAGTALSGW